MASEKKAQPRTMGPRMMPLRNKFHVTTAVDVV